MKIINKNSIKFLKYFLYFSFAMLSQIFSISVFGQQNYKIEDIQIIGNITISDIEIKNYLSIDIGLITNPEKLINLEEKLNSWGYFNSVEVIIEVDDQKKIENEINIIIKINVTENLPIKKIQIQKPYIYFTNIKFHMKLKENKAFNPKYLEKDLELISKSPFVSRVSSKITEEENHITIDIFIKYKNEVTSEIKISNNFIGEINFFNGKFFMPLYLSSLIFFPLKNEYFSPSFSISTGFSLIKDLYINVIYCATFSYDLDNFHSSFISYGMIWKGYLINNNILNIYFNPISFNLIYNLSKNNFTNLLFNGESYFKFQKIINLYNKTSFSYNLERQNSYYGYTPNNGNELSLVLNKNYNLFFYDAVFNSYPFRGDMIINSVYTKFIFVTSFDLTLKIISSKLFYIGIILSSDYLLFEENEIQNFVCWGVGFAISLSIKNIIELPFTVQYFFKDNFYSGVFYISLLSERFF